MLCPPFIAPSRPEQENRRPDLRDNGMEAV